MEYRKKSGRRNRRRAVHLMNKERRFTSQDLCASESSFPKDFRPRVVIYYRISALNSELVDVESLEKFRRRISALDLKPRGLLKGIASLDPEVSRELQTALGCS